LTQFRAVALGYTEEVPPLFRRAASVAVALLICLGNAAIRARQAPDPAGQASASPNPDVPPVRIDVIVTDANGRAVSNLKPADFQLLENGTARPLSAVELRTLSPDNPDTSPVVTEADEAKAARQPGTRVFAFYLDEFHVTAGPDADRSRDAIRQFVSDALRPQDLAVVMRPLDSLNAIRFTRDRAVVNGAIDAFTGRQGDFTPKTRFEELYMGTAPDIVAAARRQIVVSGLRELLMRLGGMQADRAAIVFVSEGFSRESLPAARSLRFQGIDALPRASGSVHVPVYTFNPAMPSGGTAGDRDRANEMLQWISDQTGGRTIAAGSEVAGLARLKHDFESYYALTYQPTAADGRFHPIEIRVRRTGTTVQARKGYWSPLASEWRTMVTTAASKLASPLSNRTLRRSNIIDTWVGLLPETKGRTRMVITWEPRTHGISAPEVVALKAKTTTGIVLFDGRLSRVGSESALPPDSARFSVPMGRVEIDMLIYNMEGKVIDSDIRDFDVPDFGAQKLGPMLLAPEVLRARTLRDFNNATTNPDAAPSSARSFTRSDRLIIRVPTLDTSGAAVQVTAKILNAWGQPMRDIDPIPAAARDGLAQFALPLSWLVPGQYQIELQGTNANGAVKERVSFRVTG